MKDFSLEKLKIHFAQCNMADSKAATTVHWYSQMLDEYIKFLTINDRKAVLAGLQPESVREFIVSQGEKGLSPYTIACRIRALRAFSSWLFRDGYTKDNVLVILKVPKTPDKMVDVLTSAEIDKLVNLQNPDRQESWGRLSPA